MALTLDELELETIELLPTREVMSGRSTGYKKCGCGHTENNWSLINVSDNDILSDNEVQVGLVNFGKF